MRDSLRQFSSYVGELSARAQECNAQELAHWAVRDLKRKVGFDSAWYGWAKLGANDVDVHANAVVDLPHDYFDTWLGMADQDLLAAGVRENPDAATSYDRYGNRQTDGMASLADKYGISKMATAMHDRPDRSTSFFLSSYRAGRHASGWSQDELDYIKCAVDQLSLAMTRATSHTSADPAEPGVTLFATKEGYVVLGLQHFNAQLGDNLNAHQGDRLPSCMRDLADCPGEHILFDRQLVMRCEHVTGNRHMDLRKLSLRRLSKVDMLTPREREVASALASGKSHKETARALGVAPSTVRNQTQSIYAKLGISSRAELAEAVHTSL
ncbi:MAG: helix-turn-helix transcriptional regulator [Pseudomonadota bacterium]